MKFPTVNSPQFDLQWRGTLADYVTAIAWCSNGHLAASNAAGEVMVWHTNEITTLQSEERCVS